MTSRTGQMARALEAANHFAKSPRFYRQRGAPTLEKYWHDPEYREQVAQEKRARQADINADIDAAQERAGTRWPSHWTEDEKADARERGQ